MFSKEGVPDGYVYPKPSIDSGIVRSESARPAPLSPENAKKISRSVHAADEGCSADDSQRRRP